MIEPPRESEPDRGVRGQAQVPEGQGPRAHAEPSPHEPGASSAARPRRIGVLIPLAGGFYFGDVLTGIEAVTSQAGVQLVVIQTAIPWPTAVHGHPMVGPCVPIAADEVDGYIAVLSPTQPGELEAVIGHRCPIVTVPSHNPDPDGVTVHADNAAGAAAGVRHLIRHGHRRIAFVGFIAQDEMRDRYEGYCRAHAEAGLEIDPALRIDVANNLESGGQEAGERLLEAGMPVTAVFAGTDLNALGLMETLQAAGLRVPVDVAIVGFDDAEQSQRAVPALTSVRQRFDDAGAAAAEAMLAILDGDTPARQILLPTALIVRHSCGCAESGSVDALSPVELDGANWRDSLAMGLALRLMAPVRPDKALVPDSLWPGVQLLVDALAAAAEEGDGPSATELDTVWQAATNFTRSAETLSALVGLLESAAVVRSGAGESAALPPRLRAFVEECRLQMLRSCVIDRHRPAGITGVLSHLGRAFLRHSPDDRANLSWLDHVPATDGCLGVWEAPDGSSRTYSSLKPEPTMRAPMTFDERLAMAPETVDRSAPRFVHHGGDRLRFALVHPASVEERSPTGMFLRPQSFPPGAWLGRATADDPRTIVVIPVGTPYRDWGFLAAAPAENPFFESYETLSQGATELTLALEHDALLDTVEEQRRRVAERERYFRALVEHSTDLVLVIGMDGRIRYASPSHERLLGRTPASVETMRPGDLLEPESALRLSRALAGARDADGPVEVGELVVRHSDGSTRTVQTVVTNRLMDPAVRGLILNSYDITARKRMEEALAEQALSDSLTGLPNRRMFNDRIAHAVAVSRRDRSSFPLLMLDLDDFKTVNDVYGHHAGDEVLRQLAERLRLVTRESDLVGRLGGDEFAVLPRDGDATGAAALARRILAALEAPIVIEGHALVVHGSIGIAVYPDDGTDVESLLKSADAAMYRAKRTRRGYATRPHDFASRLPGPSQRRRRSPVRPARGPAVSTPGAAARPRPAHRAANTGQGAAAPRNTARIAASSDPAASS